MLYSESDFQSVTAQLNKRRLMIWIPFALAVVLILVLAILRVNQVIVIALTIVSASLLIFCEGLFVHPISCYHKHIDNVMHGKTHTVKGLFRSMDPDAVIRDGVYYYSVILNVGRTNDEKDDRLLYFDANLPRPDWKTGEYLIMTAHDKAIGAWERGEPDNL